MEIKILMENGVLTDIMPPLFHNNDFLLARLKSYNQVIACSESVLTDMQMFIDSNSSLEKNFQLLGNAFVAAVDKARQSDVKLGTETVLKVFLFGEKGSVKRHYKAIASTFEWAPAIPCRTLLFLSETEQLADLEAISSTLASPEAQQPKKEEAHGLSIVKN